MEQSGSKGGWNWPVFLLSFFLGTVGSGIWFLRRKMYSIGAIFLVIFAAMTGIQLYFSIGYIDTITQWIREIVYSSTEYGVQVIPDFQFPTTYLIISLCMGIVNLVLAVCMAIFANHLYKNHCVKKINALKEQGAGAEALRAAGGTSPVWIVALLLLIASIVCSVIFMVGPILDTYAEMLNEITNNGYFYY